MAYTRGQRNAAVLHMDDGIVETAPPRPVEPSTPVQREPENYVCNVATVQRNMEAFELFRLLDAVANGFEAKLSAEQWVTLPPDVRRHFRRE